MACNRPPRVALGPGRPPVEVADVFRAHGEAFRQRHRVSGEQLKVMRDICACRTSVLGGHLDVCLGCGSSHPSYNSCRNRHCPKCQSLAQAQWIEARLARLLPIHYFHVVFTLPSSLRALVKLNRVLLFDLLFASTGRALLDLGDDPRRLGGQLGITCVLHTWTRELCFHPHVHCIVTGGGLAPTLDHWVPARKKYLFPVLVLGALYRGKFLAGLRRLYHDGKLVLSGACAKLADPSAFAQLLDSLSLTPWVVYAKPPFAGPEQVFRYLGRYTHRVGLSNQRLLAFDEHGVRFVTKGDKTLTLPPQEFIARFLQHVLPPRFVKIRHYGLHASGHATTRLVTARTLLERAASPPPRPAPVVLPEVPPPKGPDLLRELTGIDIRLCPRCGTQFVRLVLVPRPLAVAPPAFQDTS